MDYLKKEDDVPDESQDDGGVSISNISCINTDQLNLNTHICLCFVSLASQREDGGHVSMLPVVILTFLSSRKDRTLAMLLSLKIRWEDFLNP